MTTQPSMTTSATSTPKATDPRLDFTVSPADITSDMPVNLMCELPSDQSLHITAVSFMQISKVKADESVNPLVELISLSQQPILVDSDMLRRSHASGSLDVTAAGGVHLGLDIGHTGTWPHEDGGRYRCDVTFVGHGVKGQLIQGVVSAEADLHVWSVTSLLSEMTSLRGQVTSLEQQLANLTDIYKHDCSRP